MRPTRDPAKIKAEQDLVQELAEYRQRQGKVTTVAKGKQKLLHLSLKELNDLNWRKERG